MAVYSCGGVELFYLFGFCVSINNQDRRAKYNVDYKKFR